MNLQTKINEVKQAKQQYERLAGELQQYLLKATMADILGETVPLGNRTIEPRITRSHSRRLPWKKINSTQVTCMSTSCTGSKFNSYGAFWAHHSTKHRPARNVPNNMPTPMVVPAQTPNAYPWNNPS